MSKIQLEWIKGWNFAAWDLRFITLELSSITYNLKGIPAFLRNKTFQLIWEIWKEERWLAALRRGLVYNSKDYPVFFSRVQWRIKLTKPWCSWGGTSGLPGHKARYSRIHLSFSARIATGNSRGNGRTENCYRTLMTGIMIIAFCTIGMMEPMILKVEYSAPTVLLAKDNVSFVWRRHR